MFRLKLQENYLISSERGAVLPLIAVALFGFLTIIAFAIETSFAYGDQSRMQGAADNAARAGAQLKATMNTSATMIDNAAYSVAAANGYINGVDSVVVSVDQNPTPIGTFNLSYGVQVTISKSRNTIFDALVGRSTIRQEVRALAAWDYAPCIVALAQNASNGGNSGISFSGNGNINAGCGMWSNWTGQYSINPNGNVQVFASGFMTNGSGTALNSTSGLYGPCDASGVCSTTNNSPNVNTNAGVFPNPYANTSDAVPSGSGNNNGLDPLTGLQIQNISATTYCTNGNTLSPGNYRGSNTQNSRRFPPVSGTAANCVLSPGTYYVDTLVMNNSDFIQSGPCTTTTPSVCGVTIVVSGNTTSANAINLAGGEIDINPASSGAFRGVSLFSNSSKNVSFGAQLNQTCTGTNNNCGINGLVVLQNSDLGLSGGAGTTQNCVTYLAKSVTVGGGVTLGGNGCAAQTTNASTARTYKLVE